MQYWERALKRLESSDQSCQAIYDIAFSFGPNVFFEYSSAGKYHTMRYDECRICIEHAAKTVYTALAHAPTNAFVALRLENSPEWVIAFWAILMAGFRPILLNPRASDADNETILRAANAVAILSDRPFSDFLLIDTRTFAQLCLEAADFAPRFANAFALCSSGTSSIPKLCIHDGATLSAQILNSKYVMKCNSTINTEYKGELKLLAFLPFCHIFGFVALLMWFSFFGRTFVFPRNLTAAAIRDACIRHGVTHLFGVPLLFNAAVSQLRRTARARGEEEKLMRLLRFSISLQNAFPRFGGSLVRGVICKSIRRQLFGHSVMFCITGGGGIPEDTLFVCNALGYALYNGYGLTEAGITSAELRLPAKKRLSGSIGTPFPSVEYRIAPEGSTRGELMIRGSSICRAQYEGDVAVQYDAGAFLHTGDMAFRDADGFYHLEGRMDDMLLTAGGEKTSPDALEARFMHEHILRLCVIPDVSDRIGGAPVLVLNLVNQLTPFQYRRFLSSLRETNRALPLSLQVARVLIADTPLPAALGLKVRRGEVRNALADGKLHFHEVRLTDAVSSNDAEEDCREILDEVLCVFRELFPEQAASIGSDTHLVYDLACDSLRFFALTERLGTQFSVSFAREGAGMPSTPHEFADYIAEHA